MKNYFFNCEYILRGQKMFYWGHIEFDLCGENELGAFITKQLADAHNVTTTEIKDLNLKTFNEI